MGRTFIAQRGQKNTNNDRQSNHVRHTMIDQHTIQNAVEIFIKAKEAEGIRKSTIKGYYDTVRYFQEWLNPDIEYIDQITSTTLRDYINYLKNERLPYQGDNQRERTSKGLSVSTINIRLRNLKAIFRFLFNEEIINKNPTMNIPLVKDDAHEEVQGLADKEIDSILESYDDKLFAQWRDKTLVLLLLDTGLRINEAMTLTVDQVDFQQNTVLVPSEIAKNRKYREIPISREISKRLRQLLDETEQYFGQGTQIFMNAYGDDFTADAFRKRLNRLKKKLNIPKLHPHMFRHTFARNYILNGGDVFTLQKILDHADIQTTRKYIQMDSEHLRQQHNKFSPVRRLFNRKGKKL
ncbi:tyrosine-type recombinase/integrase [Neobacillus sp. BF23-41]|uniref:tyrosine-type recombinase/integrase n=1 Tax=Neobacillus sp. BF23-41 TaxID=3240280 RepID=UPI0034E5DCA6